MGRNKIPIKKIQEERKRLTTFKKRKDGLLKKAMELSVLCDVEIAIVMFSTANGQTRLHDYSSNSVSATLSRLSKFEGPVESKNNSTLYKKVDPHFQILHYHPSHDQLTQNAYQASLASMRRKPAPGHHFPIYRVSPFLEDTLYPSESAADGLNTDDNDDDEDDDQDTSGQLSRSHDGKLKFIESSADLHGHLSTYNLSASTSVAPFNKPPSESAPAILDCNVPISGRSPFQSNTADVDIGLGPIEVGVGIGGLGYSLQDRSGRLMNITGSKLSNGTANEPPNEYLLEKSNHQQQSPDTSKQSREILGLDGLPSGIESFSTALGQNGPQLVSFALGMSIGSEYDDEYGRYVGTSRMLSTQIKERKGNNNIERKSPTISKKTTQSKSKAHMKKTLSIIVPNKNQDSPTPVNSKSLLNQFKPEILLPSPTNETPGGGSTSSGLPTGINGIPLISPKNSVDPLDTPRNGVWGNFN